MDLQVLYLGPARDFVGLESERVGVPAGSTIADLRRILAEKHPTLAPALSTVRFAIDEDFATDETVLSTGNEVAVIPPVSGGDEEERVQVELVREPIRREAVQSFVAGSSSVGAIVTFEGTTRGEHDPDHGALAALHYEAYESMARRQLEQMAREAVGRWSLERVGIVHRLGRVPLGEASVFVAVAAGHRAEAFEACRWLMDVLKRDVPIWKKDVFSDGHVRWVEPHDAATP